MNTLGRIKWHQALRTKLIAVIILTTTIVLGAAGYFAYKFIQESEQSELNQLAEVSATRLSQHLAIPMWNLDREQVAELLTAEMQELKVAGIVVRDEDRRTLFAAKERSNAGDVVDSVGSLSGQNISVDREVMNKDEKIGVVSIFVTPEFMKEDLKQFGQAVIATVIILNLAIFIIMMMVLGRVLINPLQNLAGVAEQISRGDLNQNIDVSSRDEIGYLATTFNRMQTSLKVAIRRLTKK